MSNQPRKESYYLLTPDEVKFFKALSSMIVPSGKDPKAEPGANEVGAANYIDSTLHAFPPPVQEYFRDCISVVNTLSIKKDWTFLQDFNQILQASPTLTRT
ncbi:MAG: gluconate 2-dehydrogenase subunit 3 family protein [Thaumarchaeota archaeon]|nr:gluconate 2-dehydrogenase subunit 3 family protein [Nitrososphaerota archaeon]